MANAQFITLGPFFSSGSLVTSPKLYHYSAGTTTDKNIWSDRGETTTLAQPFVGDSNGVFNFFADGLYKLVIKDSSDNTLYTLDNFLIKDLSAPSLAEGSAIASAQTTVLGDEVFAHITGTTNIEGLSNDNLPFFWAVFDGDLTLVHSATFLCPGTVNLAVKTGDIVFFLREGAGSWRVAGFMRKAGIEGSQTNATLVTHTLTATTSGTPAAGIGTAQLYQSESADENPSDVGQTEFAFSDVGSGTEDSYFQVLLRVAGAALTACWRWAATGAFKGICTHANSADRTYTFPNASGTVIIAGQNNVGTGELKTSTGSSTVSDTRTLGASGSTAGNVALNDYSFYPSVTYEVAQTNPTYDGNASWKPYGSTSDPNNTVGRLQVTATSIGDAGVSAGITTVTIRWRYVTASDMPEMWVAFNSSGGIVATWASDDPVPQGMPGVLAAGCTSARFLASDLERLPILTTTAAEAQAYIRDRKLRMQHQAYRALQLLANDQAPSKWLLDNCEIRNGKLEMKRG